MQLVASLPDTLNAAHAEQLWVMSVETIGGGGAQPVQLAVELPASSIVAQSVQFWVVLFDATRVRRAHPEQLAAMLPVKFSMAQSAHTAVKLPKKAIPVQPVVSLLATLGRIAVLFPEWS